MARSVHAAVRAHSGPERTGVGPGRRDVVVDSVSPAGTEKVKWQRNKIQGF